MMKKREKNTLKKSLIFGILFTIVMSTDRRANDIESMLKQQMDQWNQPVHPVAIIPVDFQQNRIFLPFHEKSPQKLAIGMTGVGQQYRLTALWLDEGESMRILESRDELNEAEYIRRYGNGSAEERSIPDGILYQGKNGGVRLTEPLGFDLYVWEQETIDTNTWKTLQSGTSNYYVIPDNQLDASFRCRVLVDAHEYITGSGYDVKMLRLGVIQGIQIVEENK